MRTEKQLLQLAEARKHIKHRPLSEETKRKIGAANSKGFKGTCDYCGIEYSTKESAYNRAKRHFVADNVTQNIELKCSQKRNSRPMARGTLNKNARSAKKQERYLIIT